MIFAAGDFAVAVAVDDAVAAAETFEMDQLVQLVHLMSHCHCFFWISFSSSFWV